MRHLRAKIVPYSSTVGTSLLIYDQGGAAPIAQLALFSVRVDEGQTHRGQSEAIAEIVKNALSSASPPAPLGGMAAEAGNIPNEYLDDDLQYLRAVADSCLAIGFNAGVLADINAALRNLSVKLSAASRKAEPDPWQDIASAPRDGTPILVVRDNGCGWDFYVVWWTQQTEYPWQSEHPDQAYPADRFDAWRPLPAPPSTETEVG